MLINVIVGALRHHLCALLLAFCMFDTKIYLVEHDESWELASKSRCIDEKLRCHIRVTTDVNFACKHINYNLKSMKNLYPNKRPYGQALTLFSFILRFDLNPRPCNN